MGFYRERESCEKRNHRAVAANSRGLASNHLPVLGQQPAGHRLPVCLASLQFIVHTVHASVRIDR